MKSNFQDRTVGVCEGLTQSVGKKSLQMHRETGGFLWDEYAPKTAELIQIYWDRTALCPGASLHGPVFLDADVHCLKLHWLMLEGWFVVFFSFSH